MAHKGGKYGRTRGKAERERRKKEASERASIRSQRSPVEQLVELDRRLGGKGKGAARERARLS